MRMLCSCVPDTPAEWVESSRNEPHSFCRHLWHCLCAIQTGLSAFLAFLWIRFDWIPFTRNLCSFSGPHIDRLLRLAGFNSTEFGSVFFLPFWGGVEPSALLMRPLLACCTSPGWWMMMGAVGGKFGRGNWGTWRKPAPMPLCPPQIPHDLTRAWTRVVAVGSRPQLRHSLTCFG
jgi:hypothetical protein